MIKASVIIPTYNRADVIRQSLETWTKQSLTVSEYEVIVVDNNSSDNTAIIVDQFVKQFANFRYLKEIKAGATFVRHTGAKSAKSEVLIFADDDGLFNKNCIEEILKVYKLNSEIDAVAGKIEILWDKTPPEWIKPYEFMLGKLDYGDIITTGHDLYLNGGLFSIRKNVFNELGGFNPDLIGDYLVGDGDTGLVRKLHNNNHLIGWTPFASMMHMQFVDKHGTMKGLGRRFYNTGIGDTYAAFRANDFKMNSLIWQQAAMSLIFLCKKWLEFNLFGIQKRKAYFSLMQRKGELTFFGRWVFSSAFRKSCKTETCIP